MRQITRQDTKTTPQDQASLFGASAADQSRQQPLFEISKNLPPAIIIGLIVGLSWGVDQGKLMGKIFVDGVALAPMFFGPGDWLRDGLLQCVEDC